MASRIDLLYGNILMGSQQIRRLSMLMTIVVKQLTLRKRAKRIRHRTSRRRHKTSTSVDRT